MAMANEDDNEITLETPEIKEMKTSKQDDLLYSVDDVPPWYLAVLLGLQNYLMMLSGVMVLPYMLAPALCLDSDSPARAYLLSSLLFGSGIVTILQAVIGVRLPIIQGGTFTFIIPMLNMLSLPEWKCPTVENTNVNVTSESMNQTEIQHIDKYDGGEIWQYRMRTMQGSIMLACLLEVFLGLTGCVGLLLHLITPLTIVPTITLIGLSLLEVTTDLASQNWAVAITTITLLLIFSQTMKSIKIPILQCIKGKVTTLTRLPIISLIPILLTIVVMWSTCAILTATNVLSPGNNARTDGKVGALNDSPWVSVPYPGQWGVPNVSMVAVIGLLASVIASIIESIGDYYACARLSGASPPPAHAINRGIMIEGVGCVVTSLFGNVAGSTSYSGCVGAIGITRVGSRRVIIISGIFMLIFGAFTKFGAILISIPSPVMGGIFFVIFGMVTSTGLTNLQFVNLNSSRNLAILGFSLFSGLAIPRWLLQNKDSIHTGSHVADQVLFMLLTTSMLVGGLLGCLLDNIIPGNTRDRGLLAWKQKTQTCLNAEEQCNTYDIPFVTSYVQKWRRWTRFIPICPTFEEFGKHSQSSTFTEKEPNGNVETFLVKGCNPGEDSLMFSNLTTTV